MYIYKNLKKVNLKKGYCKKVLVYQSSKRNSKCKEKLGCPVNDFDIFK